MFLQLDRTQHLPQHWLEDKPVIRTILRLLGGSLLILAVIPAAMLPMTDTRTTQAGALGGPVIIGGDDLDDHGSVDVGGNVIDGWLYMKRALAAIEPDTSRGDGSIAALGSAAAPETNGGDAGAAIGAAAQELGLSVTYYEGDAAINGFFSALGGSADPSIIWIPGDGAQNSLDSDEAGALTGNAAAISSFVASGGGLFSHGSEFGWLTALLPDAIANGDDSSSDDLYFTPEGLSTLTGLTESDINAGPWHNFFEGDFGGLDVLVRSGDVDDALGQDAAVILGGSQVTFEENPGGETDEECDELVPGIPCEVLEEGTDGGGGGSETGGTPGTASTPVPSAPTSTPPAAPTATGGGQQGVITAPDTGSGPGSGGGSVGLLALAAVLALTGLAVLGASFGFARRS